MIYQQAFISPHMMHTHTLVSLNLASVTQNRGVWDQVPATIRHRYRGHVIDFRQPGHMSHLNTLGTLFKGDRAAEQCPHLRLHVVLEVALAQPRYTCLGEVCCCCCCWPICPLYRKQSHRWYLIRDLNIGSQGLALIQGRIYNPI